MTSTLPKGTLGSVASLLAATLYQQILIGITSSGISYHLRDIYSMLLSCQINTTGATSGAEIAYPSGTPEFNPRFLAEFVLLDL
jgi:hypothetical protein